MKRRTFVLASVVLLGLGRPAPAQEPAYVEDLRFVHELRQRGDTDLAMLLLADLEKTGSPQLKNELPFEYALCRKALAVNETDSAKRLKLYAEARAELVKFRDANPNHPRIAETKIDIADITVQEARTQMSQAFAKEGVEAQSVELEKARKTFEAAGLELKAITDELEKRLVDLADPKTPEQKVARIKLDKTRIRADLSVALNLFDIAQTFHREHSKTDVLIERGRRVQAAVKALDKVAANDDTYTEVWQARAWLGRCEHELGKPKTARERYVPIIDSRSAAAADGARLARYFRLLVIQEQLGSGQAEKGEDTLTLIDGARRWMRDYPRSLATAEGNGIRYLLAESLLTMAGVEKLAEARKKEYRDEARKLLSVLADTENEYTDRAKHMEIRLIGLEGGFTKAVKELQKFDDCYVRAQYEAMEMMEDARKLKGTELEAKQKARNQTIIEALERGLGLADLKTKTSNKGNNARAMLTFYYLTARNYARAIEVGEKFAREVNTGPSGLAAAYTLQAYGILIAEREAGLKEARTFRDDEGKTIDEAQYRTLLENNKKAMLAFCAYCMKTWEKELAGNLARQQIAAMHFRNKQFAEGIKVLNGITPEFPSYPAVQFQIAEVSLQAAADGAEPFADPAKGEKAPVPFRERGLAALRNVPESNGALDQNRLYFQAKTRLGLELYRDSKFADMEALAAPLLPKAAAMTFHDDEKVNGDIREHFKNQLNRIRLLARVGQAAVDFKAGGPDGNKKVAALAAPVLADLKANPPAAKIDPQSAQALQALLSMALQANVQLGDLDKVRLIVEVYGKAVGENPDEVAVPEIVRRLVPLIRVQMKELNAKADGPAKDRAVKAFSAIIDDVKKQQGDKEKALLEKIKTIPDMEGKQKAEQEYRTKVAEFLLVLAQCYGSMDEYPKALDLLKAIAEPAPGDTKGEEIYHSACLARLRLLRQKAGDPANAADRAKIVKEASDLLNGWMAGKDGKPGWAAKMIDAHKERLHLYDMEGEVNAGFNKAQALVKSLSAKNINPNDLVNLNNYLECYYYMVYFLNESAKKAPATREQRTAEAASRIIALEGQYKDYGTEEMKQRFTALLDNERDLKTQYEKLKKK